MSKKATYRFPEHQDKWLEETAKAKGSTKNQLLRDLVNKEMKAEAMTK